MTLPQVEPGHVGAYMDRLRGSVPSRKLHLAALRAFFDRLCARRIVPMNPAACPRRAVAGGRGLHPGNHPA
jgi:hypothetical protein